MKDLIEQLRLSFMYRIWMSIYYLTKRKYFDHLKTYCFFIGYSRSGHTLLGALIDSHPNSFISIEANVFRLLEKQFKRKQILAFIVRKSNFFYKKKDGTWTGYDYKVPGLWQNNFKEIHVIGDKKGAGSSKILHENPRLLSKLKDEIKLPIKIIHVVRNPYDIITTATMAKAKRNKIDPYGHFNNRINMFIQNAETNQKLIDIHKDSIYTIRHEELIANPNQVLKKLFNFLNLPYEDSYISKLTEVIYKKPNITRYKLTWSSEQIEKVAGTIAKHKFLHGYSYNG